jgi:hypothetical protein
MQEDIFIASEGEELCERGRGEWNLVVGALGVREEGAFDLLTGTQHILYQIDR